MDSLLHVLVLVVVPHPELVLRDGHGDLLLVRQEVRVGLGQHFALGGPSIGAVLGTETEIY